MQTLNVGPFEIRDAVRMVLSATGDLEGDLNSQRLIWHLKNTYGIDIRNVTSTETLQQFELSLKDVFGDSSEQLINLLYQELEK